MDGDPSVRFGPNVVRSLHWINAKLFEISKIDLLEKRSANPLSLRSIWALSLIFPFDLHARLHPETT